MYLIQRVAQLSLNLKGSGGCCCRVRCCRVALSQANLGRGFSCAADVTKKIKIQNWLQIFQGILQKSSTRLEFRGCVDDWDGELAYFFCLHFWMFQSHAKCCNIIYTSNLQYFGSFIEWSFQIASRTSHSYTGDS